MGTAKNSSWCFHLINQRENRCWRLTMPTGVVNLGENPFLSGLKYRRRAVRANPAPLPLARPEDGCLGLPRSIRPWCTWSTMPVRNTRQTSTVCVCPDTLCRTPTRYVWRASWLERFWLESAQTSCRLSRADTAPEEAAPICQREPFAKHKRVHTFTRPLLAQRWIAFITRILIFKRNWWAPGKESRMLSHIWELCFTQPLQQLAFAGRDERYWASQQNTHPRQGWQGAVTVSALTLAWINQHFPAHSGVTVI